MPTFSLQLVHAQLDRHNAETMARIARETGDMQTGAVVLSRLGDEKQLRGIPAIGRGVAGHISGTNPGAYA